MNEERQCPICAETIKAAAIRCRFCGADLQANSSSKAEIEQVLFVGHPAVIYSSWQRFFIFVTFGLAWLGYKAKSLAFRYEITTQRIKIERGYLDKVRESVELFTIEHFEIASTWGMRREGYCELNLRSSDPNIGFVSLYGIEDLERLADTLRECSFHERQRRRVTALIMP